MKKQNSNLEITKIEKLENGLYEITVFDHNIDPLQRDPESYKLIELN